MNLAKYRKAQQDLERAEERADQADTAVSRLRSRGAGGGVGGGGGVRNSSVGGGPIGASSKVMTEIPSTYYRIKFTLNRRIEDHNN